MNWTAPSTYGVSKYEVQSDEMHARQIAIVNNMADAYLISSAPELIEALRDALLLVETLKIASVGNVPVIAQCDKAMMEGLAAINKANGVLERKESPLEWSKRNGVEEF